MPLITWEFNQFCVGNHPCFSGRNSTPLIKFDGSKATKDMRIESPDQMGCYYRFSHDLKEAMLCTGMTQRPTNDLAELKEVLDTSDELEDAKLIRGSIEQYQHVIDTLKKSSTMAIQDDYTHWKENDKHSECSKLLMIDQADYQTQHIFFDSSADPDEDCIIDVRDAVTSEILPYKKFIGRYVVQAEPHRAILETDYFIKQIEQAERSRDEEIQRVEAGIIEEEDDDQKPSENEWAEL